MLKVGVLITTIKHFIKEQGICHIVLPEGGHVKPGMFIVGGDSHSVTGGAFGTFHGRRRCDRNDRCAWRRVRSGLASLKRSVSMSRALSTPVFPQRRDPEAMWRLRDHGLQLSSAGICGYAVSAMSVARAYDVGQHGCGAWRSKPATVSPIRKRLTH